uniref:ATP-dependent DNA helicase n=1 Tax=Amphimedon queenslandica TaxID=400682 RepID=A0A1X7VSZ3_AMPQE
MLHVYQSNLIILMYLVTWKGKQFLLILSYAITIHKCQGLSLDTAILIDRLMFLGMVWHMLHCLVYIH